MKFIKDNSYDIVKLFVNQIGITIFSLVLYTAVGSIGDEATMLKVRVLLSVFSCIFYFALIYCASWDFGARDIIRVEGGKIDNKPAKGALISLVSNSPNFVLAAVSIVSMLIYIFSENQSAFRLFAGFNLLLRFLNAMFIGALQGIFSFMQNDQNGYYLWQSVGFFAAPFLTVLFSHLGYTLGLKNYKLFGFLMPNRSNSKK